AGHQPVGRWGHRLAPQLGEAAQQLLLLLAELGRHLDDDGDEQVAAAAPLEVGHAPAPQPEGRARRRPPGHLELLDAVERLELQRRAQHRLRVGQLDRRVQVDAVAGEAGMGPDPQVDVEVARPAAPGARRAPPREPQRRAGVDAGGDVDRVGALLDDAALAAAALAGAGDDLAGAAAAGARRRLHHRADERLAHPLHVAGALALVAGHRLGALGGAGGVALLAGDGRAHRHRVLAPEHGAGEVEVGHDLAALAPGRARLPPAPAERARPEERLEDVPEAAEVERVAGPDRALDPLGAEGVVAAALLRVGQDLVGARDLLELRLRLGVVVARVRVQLPGQAPEGALDLVLRRRAR